MSGRRVVVASTGRFSSRDAVPDADSDPFFVDAIGARGFDASRLRRMDAFGRAGFLAASRALTAAGREPRTEPDGRAGAIVGTAFGCRASLAAHAERVRDPAATLSPAIFVQTVHNAVNGELAMTWNLGGAAEVVVGGNASGLDALLLARRRLAAGRADLLVGIGADATLDGASGAGAALVLVADDGDGRGDLRPALECGAACAIPDPERAGARLGELLGGRVDRLVVEEPREETVFGLTLATVLSAGALVALAPGFGAEAAVDEAIRAIERIASGAARRIAIVVRERGGPATGVVFSAGSAAF